VSVEIERRISRGATLIELAVVLALIGIVGSIIGGSLLRQERFYRGATELLGARENVRDAMEVLATDLRGLAVADTVRLMSDSAVEFFADIGVVSTCSSATGTALGLAGRSGSRGNTFTALLTAPDSGDLAVIYRAGSDTAGPSWERARIESFASRSVATVCPEPTAFAVGEGGSGFLLTLAAPLTSPVPAGTPIRVIRRGRYSIYRAGDGGWYLGYRRCNALGPSVCGAVQPLSGPYRPYSSDRSQTGLLFEYFDGGDAPAASALDLARVRITARSESRQRILLEGRQWKPADSATVSIAVRNRAP